VALFITHGQQDGRQIKADMYNLSALDRNGSVEASFDLNLPIRHYKVTQIGSNRDN
jgi:hypothetical protein